VVNVGNYAKISDVLHTGAKLVFKTDKKRMENGEWKMKNEIQKTDSPRRTDSEKLKVKSEKIICSIVRGYYLEDW
jgi:tRNA G46 methylase TrmB